jgi:hypothetical protein
LFASQPHFLRDLVLGAVVEVQNDILNGVRVVHALYEFCRKPMLWEAVNEHKSTWATSAKEFELNLSKTCHLRQVELIKTQLQILTGERSQEISLG